MNEPFLFHGGDHGCLLIHGFSGAPDEMRPLGEYLARAGNTVLGVRLSGHGGSPTELAAARWRDWLDTSADGLAYLHERCTTVSLVGFSLGGALALMLAAAQPVERLVVASTPMHLQGDWRVNALPLVRYVMPWFYPFATADFADPEVRDQFSRRDSTLDLGDLAVQAELRKTVKISIAAIDEMRQALIQARRVLPRVRAPLLVLHGRADLVVPQDSPTIIMSRVSSPQKELAWWDDTGHQMLVSGQHRAAIFSRIAAFLANPD